MEKKLHIGPEFILAALAALCELSCLIIGFLSPAIASSGPAAIVSSALWLIFSVALPAFFLTENKLFLRLSLIMGALLRAVSIVNTVIQCMAAASYAISTMYFLIGITTLVLFVLMAVAAFLKEGKATSLIMEVGALIILLINVLMLCQMVGTLGYYHLALKFYFILSYATDVLYALALVIYALKSFTEKKKASYKNAEEALRKLKTQLENGEITDQEYTARKKEILKNI